MSPIRIQSFLIGTEPGEIAVPDGWDFDNSLSKTYTFIPTGELDERKLNIQDVNSGVKSFVDAKIGQKLYTGRAFPEKIN